MLAIDYVPTTTHEVMSRSSDITIEELYQERRLLISRLLRCKPMDQMCTKAQSAEIDDVRNVVKKMGQELSPSCPELLKPALKEDSTTHNKINHFIRTSFTPSKDKSDSKQGNRDSGFSERSYASSSEGSCNSEYSANIKIQPLTTLQVNGVLTCTTQSCDKPSQQHSDTNSQSHSASHQHTSRTEQPPTTSQNVGHISSSSNIGTDENSRLRAVDADSESVISSQTLTDSQGTNRSVPDGICVSKKHRSTRSARALRYAHQDSMFGVMNRSMLYFPKHRRKGNLIRAKLLR